jgi:hypothetical protein
VNIESREVVGSRLSYHQGGRSPMAEAPYRFVYQQDGKHFVSDIDMTRSDAFEHLALSYALHVAFGWDAERCICGFGFRAMKGGIQRSEHVEELDVLMAAGMVAPASLNGRLEVVA